MQMYSEADVDTACLADKQVTILGYGSQGHAHALSLRDSGVDVRVGLPEGSRSRAKAEAEGLHEIFLAAGAEWREAGCSMCIGMNGDIASPGQLSVSTSNRNFEGRQGVGARTVLASPATAAASAIAGHVADPRKFL